MCVANRSLPEAWFRAYRQLVRQGMFSLALFAPGTSFLSGADTNNVPGTPSLLGPALVLGSRTSVHDVILESDLVGPANQPEWTTRRVFAETDVYVIPTGEIEFNQFYVYSRPRHEDSEHLFESEIEIGLPWRTQFDVELNYSIKQG